MCHSANAQVKDTTQLDEIEVRSTRINSSVTGKKFQRLDSLTLELFKNNTLDVILSNNTPIFVKNYGPGASQTTTFRGGNASQTAILWNGLNIQNSMLGQTDLSNISGSLFNAIDVEYGGSSSLWGSGAMGGAVHLNNKLTHNKGVFAKTGVLNSNQIGLTSFLGKADYSDSLLGFSATMTQISNTNEYSYLNDSSDIVKRKNAGYEQLSGLVDYKGILNSKNTFVVSAWLAQGQRHLPSLFSTVHNKVVQEDESQRYTSNWNYTSNKLSNVVRLAYFIEDLNYSDSLAGIDSKSNMRTRIFENDLYYKWHTDHTFNIGLNYTYNQAKTESYEGEKFLEKYAVFISHKDIFLNGKLRTHAAMRLEHTTFKLDPFTFNVGADYKPHSDITLKLSTGKVYRLPTLNDRYWVPGGNPDLKPEEGYTADGTAEYLKVKGNYDVAVNGSVFYKLISNWIQWIPYGVAGYKPVNLQEVYSRGAETSWQLGFTKNKFRIQLKCLTSYVLSKVNETILANDPTLGKQLIYTPRYTTNSSLTLRYYGLTMAYLHTYVGYRFTSSDNSAWIKPYHYSTLRFMVAFQKTKIGGQLFVNINNVLNKDYQVLLNVPQPLRYTEFGMQISFRSTKKINYKTKKQTK